jgi:hypothetical protein
MKIDARKNIVGAVAVVLILPSAACDDNTSVPEAGTMSLLLTDDEGDFTQAWVTIQSIELVGGDGPLVLMDTPFTTNLLMWSNDIATLVEDVTVPGGTYSDVRLIIPEACIAVDQGGEGEDDDLVYASAGFAACGEADGGLQLPSFAETGLKVSLPGGSMEIDGDSRSLMLDFDVGQSFGQRAGSSGDWVLTPVIYADYIDMSGSIAVELTEGDGVHLSTVGSSLGDFQARLSTETEPQLFTDPDGDDVFTATFRYLMPDQAHDVSVELQGDVAAYDVTLDPMSHSVTLGAGEEATVAFVVMSATASGAPTAVDDAWQFPTQNGFDVLENDVLGDPLATLTSFGGGSLGGDVTQYESGQLVTLAGGSMIASNAGVFTFLLPPLLPGEYTFLYRITNSHGTSDATVTLTVQ